MQWRNSISITCSEQSFSFTDIPLLYSLMHFQTSISLFIINLCMFCLTLFYFPPFSTKALSGEMLSSCLPKTPPPHPFPIKHLLVLQLRFFPGPFSCMANPPATLFLTSSKARSLSSDLEKLKLELPFLWSRKTAPQTHILQPRGKGTPVQEKPQKLLPTGFFAPHPQVKVSPDTQMLEPVDLQGPSTLMRVLVTNIPAQGSSICSEQPVLASGSICLNFGFVSSKFCVGFVSAKIQF